MCARLPHSRCGALQCCPYPAEQRITLRAPAREVIVPIRSPRCDHCEHEDPAVAKQEWIGECVVIANLVGCVGDVELDWPIATRLEVNEPHAARRPQQVARVRFAVQQLLVRAAVDDGPAKAAQRVSQEFPICVDELRTLRTVSDDRLRFFDSLGEVWCRRIELPHACMQAFERLRILGQRGVGRRQRLVVRPKCDREAVMYVDERVHPRVEDSDRAVGFLKPPCHLDFERCNFMVPSNGGRDPSQNITRPQSQSEPVRLVENVGVIDPQIKC